MGCIERSQERREAGRNRRHGDQRRRSERGRERRAVRSVLTEGDPVATSLGPASLLVRTGLPGERGAGTARPVTACSRARSPRNAAGACAPRPAPEPPLLSGLSHCSDLFFNFSDAVSHHTPLKYTACFAKSSSTNKNDTWKFPNEPQVRTSSPKLAWKTS